MYNMTLEFRSATVFQSCERPPKWRFKQRRSAVERRPYRLWNSHWDPPSVRGAGGGMAVALERDPPARCRGFENAASGAMA